MSSKLHAGVFAICCLGFTIPAVAQLDSSALRAKYGSPLHRETFHMPSGFDLIVDYGASNQVCKLELSALMPQHGKVISSVSEMKQRMYDFLAELVPRSMRGKELGRGNYLFGAISLLSVEYEHVTIVEPKDENQPFGNNTITVSFKTNNCQTPPGQ
jgi:hypothetical protein